MEKLTILARLLKADQISIEEFIILFDEGKQYVYIGDSPWSSPYTHTWKTDPVITCTTTSTSDTTGTTNFTSANSNNN